MKPYYQSDSATVYCADVLEALREIPDESVQCCMTSPPYWGLRSYLDDEHPDKGLEIGLESDMQGYVSKMVKVFAEVRRVLRRDGTLWLNLGDSFAGGGTIGRNDADRNIGGLGGNKLGSGNPGPQGSRPRVSGLKAKDLAGIPWRVAFALQEDGWYLRSDIIWAKLNPMPESVTDRPTRAHEYVFLLTKAARYFYDAEAVREKGKGPYTKMPDGWDTGKGAHGSFHKNGREKGKRTDSQRGHDRQHEGFNDRWDQMIREEQQAGGANKRDVWPIGIQRFAEAHFATFPEKLVEPCVKAGTSEKGCCAECGAPWIRTTKLVSRELKGGSRGVPLESRGRFREKQGKSQSDREGVTQSDHITTGWQPTCGCGADIAPDDLEIIESPTGEVTAEDPSRRTGRAGMNRPRGPDEGKRLITRWQQRRIAEQLRSSPYRAEMKSMAGPSFSHYIRTDKAGARPPAPELLGKWIACGWVTMPELPEGCPPQPVPCTVIDPFGGSMTTGVVALKLGRHFVGIELSQEYLDDFGLDRLRAAETGLTAREVRAGQQALFNGGETK